MVNLFKLLGHLYFKTIYIFHWFLHYRLKYQKLLFTIFLLFLIFHYFELFKELFSINLFLIFVFIFLYFFLVFVFLFAFLLFIIIVILKFPFFYYIPKYLFLGVFNNADFDTFRIFHKRFSHSFLEGIPFYLQGLIHNKNRFFLIKNWIKFQIIHVFHQFLMQL